ncbi:MAG: methyltransferase domain-containing protein [Candidatus Omnitrophica bacterium]|nr:methyltransferase domain-containing protein [Candidatus Omnitrophota bacterium]
MVNFGFFKENVDLLCCPKCQKDIIFKDNGFICNSCNNVYGFFDDIPSLFYKEEDRNAGDVATDTVKSFYEENPFPNYDNLSDGNSLTRRLNEGPFERLLDASVPLEAKIIECGCGTGQLTNFLSLRGRSVIGTDICVNSLKLGQKFKEKAGIDGAHFLQMNLFYPAFKENTFDLVISKGVLHHTADPKAGFRAISRLVKPGGYILIGLYHKYGRLITNFRQVIFKLTGERFYSLDPILGDKKISPLKKKIWLYDQYKHPRESKHTLREVFGWLNDYGFSFVKSYPRFKLFGSPGVSKNAFLSEAPSHVLEILFSEIAMSTGGSKNGGFFVVIAKKK